MLRLVVAGQFRQRKRPGESPRSLIIDVAPGS
jgi:hypothetical protein